MAKKDNTKKKRLKCIDCDKASSDYYMIPTNRGSITKCAKCYELWITRSTRMSYRNSKIGKANHQWDD